MAAGRQALEAVLLELLARREMHGYELAVAVTATDPAVPDGLVYAGLRGLERAGVICGRWVEVGAAAPRRRYYVLTPKGVQIAARQALRPRAVRTAMPS